MKRIEAIAWLEVMKEDAIFEQNDALNMAIEALKEQEISNELQEYAYECGYEHFFHECQNCELRRAEPTHGRLIDVDELLKKYTTCADIDCDTCPIWECGCDGLLQILKEAPIIKDANGGDNK